MNNFYQPRYPMYQPTPQAGAMLLFVPQVSDILSVQVPQGQKVFVMAQNEPIFAVREADAFGVVQTKYCKFETYEPNASAPSGDYITRDELKNELEKFRLTMGGTTNESVIRSAEHHDSAEPQNIVSDIVRSEESSGNTTKRYGK